LPYPFEEPLDPLIENEMAAYVPFWIANESPRAKLTKVGVTSLILFPIFVKEISRVLGI
jgi:hypothetical protein